MRCRRALFLIGQRLISGFNSGVKDVKFSERTYCYGSHGTRVQSLLYCLLRLFFLLLHLPSCAHIPRFERHVVLVGGGAESMIPNLIRNVLHVPSQKWYVSRKKKGKEKRNPGRERAACFAAALLFCLCVPRASLITFKEHFQTAFRDACQHFSFLRNFSKQFGLPSLFLWFELWIINVRSSLPHQARSPSPLAWWRERR